MSLVDTIMNTVAENHVNAVAFAMLRGQRRMGFFRAIMAALLNVHATAFKYVQEGEWKSFVLYSGEPIELLTKPLSRVVKLLVEEYFIMGEVRQAQLTLLKYAVQDWRCVENAKGKSVSYSLGKIGIILDHDAFFAHSVFDYLMRVNGMGEIWETYGLWDSEESVGLFLVQKQDQTFESDQQERLSTQPLRRLSWN